ncbi:hypothetical protein FB45DRAFT_794147 [Roridomyces roridus]|uniref:Uncharacterized protein n=1 Tax=Roridomyces roridus TaxID=1738132 RepID=A0AAD7BUX8_9AGAR|nr:hypothetical protein FB45DRAFT_794147 [Roridomyces roridus]
MSLWELAPNAGPDETQTFKNKLSSKETQIAAQQNEILKQAAELAELKSTHNETLHKLHHETSRAVTLESGLAKCTEDLRNESLKAQNAAAALAGAHEKLKAKDLEARELEATLISISHNSDTFNARNAKLEKEKNTLEARVRELQLLSSSPTPTVATPARRHRPRSSSVSDTRVGTLEQELKDARASLAQKESASSAKVAQVQDDLVRVENEKTALEKRLQAEIRDLKAELQEKNDDLEYFKEQQGDGGREEELLKRIDEDEAKMAALDAAMKSETKSLKDQLRRAETQLLVESERISDMEGRNIELVQEKEEVLDELEGVKAQLLRPEAQQPCVIILFEVTSSSSFLRNITPSDEDIARLLNAIERVRGERDNLRRDVEFLQSEARFTEEGLEARIASLTAANSDLAATDAVLRSELHLLQQQLSGATAEHRAALQQKNEELRLVGLAAMASAVVIDQLQSQANFAQEQSLRASTSSEEVTRRLGEMELQASESLDVLTRQRDELLSQLALNESNWAEEVDKARAAQRETQDGVDMRLSELTHVLDEVETERNALKLQVTNLHKDLEDANREIAEAETRYSELQFHQLSAMSNHEASVVLREQLEEQKERVLRRTELVGILQHDSDKRDMNLKLQEERIMEMTTEIAAMVEDCADARQARDVAVSRVEDLEAEVEELEGKLVNGDEELRGVVLVLVETVIRARDALQQVPAAPEPAVESMDWEAQVSELDKKQQDLQSLVDNLKAEHQVEIERLTGQLAEKDRLLSDNDLEGELATLKIKHVEEMGLLQGRLVETTSALDEAQARLEAVQEEHRQALSESQRRKEELEVAAGDATTQAEALRVDVTRIQDEHAAAVETLEARISSAISDAEKLQTAHQELEAMHQRTLDELAEIRETSETHIRELEDRVAELDAELEERTSRCDALGKDADSLRLELRKDAEERAIEVQELNANLRDAQERRERAESAARDLTEELSGVAEELSQTQEEIESLQEERSSLQEEITALQAEIQRSLSLHRFLENQVKEKEQLAASLTTELEHVQELHARAEKAGKSAEVNLSLQGVQYRREVSELQQQLAALQSRPDLTTALADLEDRNNEMEELLKNKCAEIEENDDRALEMLKNNKKLTAKVESLTRKVQNLQAKLAAAKATGSGLPMDAPEFKASPSFPTVVPSTRPRSNTLTAIPPVPSLPFGVPASPIRPSNRVASGSALPRPKTPERRALPQVFKAQTPERRTAPAPPSPSATVIGQKRRAPDDFEDVRVPAQGFTADSLPDENGTPRVRRVLNSLHSGFTPVRQGARVAVPSPKRALPSRTSPFMTDVTNSPGGESKMKPARSWLGKIRGTSQPRPGGY